MHEIETWAPGSAACALCVINISSHETGRPAGRGGGGGARAPWAPPLDPHCMQHFSQIALRVCTLMLFIDIIRAQSYNIDIYIGIKIIYLLNQCHYQ